MRSVIATASIVLMIGACGNEKSEVQLSYYRDVKPIIDSNCVGCHTDGGIGPFVLTSYAAVKAETGKIATEVHERRMPPWPPALDCTDYHDSRALSETEISTILDWIHDGAPEGKPSDAVAKIEQHQVLTFTPDLSLEMVEPYSAQLSPDDYRCFLISWPEVTNKYVTGFNVIPGDPSVVHHVIAFTSTPEDAAAYQALDDGEAGPGYTCFSGSGLGAFDGGFGLGGWAPGYSARMFPENTGVLMRPGSLIVLQVHYNTLEHSPVPDQTRIEMTLADTVLKEGFNMPFVNPFWLAGAMHIPANQGNVARNMIADPTTYVEDFFPDSPLHNGVPLVFYSANLHMHLLGKSARTHIVRQDASTDCMLNIEDWDFHWQSDYFFDTPKVVNPGDQIYLECVWDNTVGNQPEINGVPQVPKDTWWGEGTTDEMCLGIYYVTEQ